MATDIRIEMFKDRGWSLIGGMPQVLNPNYLPISVTSSLAETFTATYKGIEYSFPMAALGAFLTRSDLYIPYPRYMILNSTSDYMTVGSVQEVTVTMYYSTGLQKKLTDEDIELISSNEDVLEVELVGDKVLIKAVGAGEAEIIVNYDLSNRIRKSMIVVELGKKLFAQSHYTGQFPNGIN